MTIPLLAFTTATLSLFNPGLSNSPSSKNSSIINSNSSSNIRFLFTGIVAGMGLYAYIDNKIRRYRIRERTRAWLYSQQTELIFTEENIDVNKSDFIEEQESKENLDESIGNKNQKDYGILIPTPAKNLPSILLSENDEFVNATMRILACPKMPSALTSSLYVLMITLPFGSKMEMREAKGVEIYYVLQGRGKLFQMVKYNFSRDEEDESDQQYEEHVSTINSGKTFLVNPWSIRWIANDGPEDLTFLRISDAGNEYLKEVNYDVVVKSNETTTVNRIFSSGITNVKYMANKASKILKSKVY